MAGRWPTALALVASAGAIVVITSVGREAEFFGPAVAVMAAIYLTAYAAGRPRTAWPAFAVLSAVVSVLHVLRKLQILEIDPGVTMAMLLVPLWLWTLPRFRSGDVTTFWTQTAGMVGCGGIALLCTMTSPKLGATLAGVGFLLHGAWDAYHFVTRKVVAREWSEFCGIVDVVVGVTLVVAAMGM
jgi:hypothetical protein